MRDFTQQRLFKKYRHDWTFDFVGEFKGKNLSLEKRAALAFKISCEALEPIVFPDEKISFVRTVNNVPAYYEPKEAKKALGVEKDAVLHPLNNLTINWEKLLNEGLSGRLELCREKLSKTKDKQKRDFLEAAVIVIEAVANLAERYEAAAEAAALEMGKALPFKLLYKTKEGPYLSERVLNSLNPEGVVVPYRISGRFFVLRIFEEAEVLSAKEAAACAKKLERIGDKPWMLLTPQQKESCKAVKIELNEVIKKVGGDLFEGNYLTNPPSYGNKPAQKIRFATEL